jgi:adenine deaminase
MVLTDLFKQNLNQKKHIIQVAQGEIKADLVLKNATYLNVFSNELLTADIAIADGKIAGIGTYSGDLELDLEKKLLHM